MYDTFGAWEDDDSKRITFRLFVPGNMPGEDPQFVRGTVPDIASVHAAGNFQSLLGSTDWTADADLELEKSIFTDPEDGKYKGWLYELTTPPLLDGFYEYKYIIKYTDGNTRFVCDPCTRYGGEKDQNGGVVVGGPKSTVTPLAHPLPLDQLIIYELMLDDFTAGYRGSRAPLDAVIDKLDDLHRLGFNAIQFMPWTEWPGEGYNWGYEPQSYFSVAYRYAKDPADPTRKLFHLKRLINECHRRDIHVIFDAVFNHVTGAGPGDGFGYRWLWQNPDDSPYIGIFAEHAYGPDLDYANPCTDDFAFDVCRYWINFGVDGIRFDNTSGLYVTGLTAGLPNLLTRLRGWLTAQERATFPLILEHAWDYTSVNVVNKVNATSCWLDPFRSRTRDFLSQRHVRPDIMRLLDSGRDFLPDKTPVTYIENHDHESFALNAGSREEWWRIQPYAIALLTAAGAPMIHNGQEFSEMYRMPEFGAETGGDDDPAHRRIVPRPLRWHLSTDGPGQATANLYQRLITIRKAHPALTSLNFHPRGWEEGWTQLDADGFGFDEARQIAVYHRWGDTAGGGLEKLYIVLNFSQTAQTVELSFPADGTWEDLLTGWKPDVQGNQLRFEIGSNWGYIFYREF